MVMNGDEFTELIFVFLFYRVLTLERFPRRWLFDSEVEKKED